MKKALSLLLGVYLIGLTPEVALSAEKKSAAISGNVVLVKTVSNQVLVAHKKPGALIEIISTFKVDAKTQLKNVNNLASLKINDPVSVTYTESETGDFLAQTVEKEQGTSSFKK